MVAVASASFFEHAVTKKAAFSQEGLRALFGQVEAELYRSEIYQRVLASLQTAMGDRTDNPQPMVRAVAREAIRLAFRQMVKQYQAAGTAGQATSQAATSDDLSPRSPQIPAGSSYTSQSSQKPAPEPGKALPLVSTQETSKAIPPSQSLNRPRQGDEPHRMIVSTSRKSTRADSPANQKRLTLLRQIGAALQQTRQEKGISLDQLYSSTWIPVHQIRALEMADMDRLPEDIYVQGFIRRLGDALGLDGRTLANTLQVLESSKAVIPSWHQRSPETPTLRPMHLYLSYAALMAGALGGLAWISYDSTANELPAQTSPAPSQQSLTQSSRGTTQVAPASQNSAAISTPEMTAPETSSF